MVVLFIGSNPSQKSTTIIPFWANTNSSKILNSWIDKVKEQVNVEEVHCLNVANYPTPGNRPLKMPEIKAELDRLAYDIYGLRGINPDKVVALGKTAQTALTLLHIPHYAMPHPSGLNRQLNDPKFVEEKINGLVEFLTSIRA